MSLTYLPRYLRNGTEDKIAMKNTRRIEIAEIPKAHRATIRIALDVYKGRRVLDLRVWYQPHEDGEFVPTRKGVTIDAEKVPELVAAMFSAGTRIAADDLVAPRRVV